jgi:hypothetical protein
MMTGTTTTSPSSGNISSQTQTGGSISLTVNDDGKVDTSPPSVGDSVQIKGLVSAPQYNGMIGIVFSELNLATNRCGVKIHVGGTAKTLALQYTI